MPPGGAAVGRYWSFPVRDPMGNTVELSTTDRNAWPADTE